MWGTIKSYASLLFGGLLTILASLTAIFYRSSKKQRERAERNERAYRKAVEIAEKDREVEREHDQRTEDLAKEIEEKKSSSELSDPNRW